MMQFKNKVVIMEDMNKEIKYLMPSFKDILMVLILIENILFWIIHIQKWGK